MCNIARLWALNVGRGCLLAKTAMFGFLPKLMGTLLTLLGMDDMSRGLIESDVTGVFYVFLAQLETRNCLQ